MKDGFVKPFKRRGQRNRKMTLIMCDIKNLIKLKKVSTELVTILILFERRELSEMIRKSKRLNEWKYDSI